MDMCVLFKKSTCNEAHTEQQRCQLNLRAAHYPLTFTSASARLRTIPFHSVPFARCLFTLFTCCRAVVTGSQLHVFNNSRVLVIDFNIVIVIAIDLIVVVIVIVIIIIIKL